MIQGLVYCRVWGTFVLIAACFILQLLLAGSAFFLGLRLSRLPASKASLLALLAFALMLAFPLMRVWPVFSLSLLGPAFATLTEFTGMAMPAALLFGIATPRLPRPADRKAVYALIVIAGVYFIKAGWWMLSPGTGDLGPTKWKGDVCLQTTDSTCVAASMVTLLKSRGVESTETEMAALGFVEPGGGTTDTRAAWALERKLAAVGRTDLRVRYEHMTLEQLIATPKPCMVALQWGFFMSHMVCVMDANDTTITLGDPLSGRRVLRVQEFVKEWKGETLRLE